MKVNLTRTALILAIAMIGSACDRAIVYGDRTGFNLALRTDVAEGHPVEVNAGLQRRVGGFAPPRKRDKDGNAVGEAANLMSRFELARKAGEGLGLSDTIWINSAFVSGDAAVKASQNADSVASIFSAPGIRVSDDPQDVDAIGKLLNFTAASDENRLAYLALARARGLKVAPDTDPFAAQDAIVNSANASGNREIAIALKL